MSAIKKPESNKYWREYRATGKKKEVVKYNLKKIFYQNKILKFPNDC